MLRVGSSGQIRRGDDTISHPVAAHEGEGCVDHFRRIEDFVVAQPFSGEKGGGLPMTGI